MAQSSRAESGEAAEASIGRSLQRSHRRRLSREPPHPRPMASRPSARRSALGADLPGDRARRRRGGPYPSRAPHGQSHAARPDWRVPHRSDAGLPWPQRRPLFRPADRRRQGRRTNSPLSRNARRISPSPTGRRAIRRRARQSRSARAPSPSRLRAGRGPGIGVWSRTGLPRGSFSTGRARSGFA